MPFDRTRDLLTKLRLPPKPGTSGTPGTRARTPPDPWAWASAVTHEWYGWESPVPTAPGAVLELMTGSGLTGPFLSVFHHPSRPQSYRDLSADPPE